MWSVRYLFTAHLNLLRDGLLTRGPLTRFLDTCRVKRPARQSGTHILTILYISTAMK